MTTTIPDAELIKNTNIEMGISPEQMAMIAIGIVIFLFGIVMTVLCCCGCVICRRKER